MTAFSSKNCRQKKFDGKKSKNVPSRLTAVFKVFCRHFSLVRETLKPLKDKQKNEKEKSMKKYEKFDGKKTYRTRKSTSLNGGGGGAGGKALQEF